MPLRRIVLTLLLSATPALAQLEHDPENDPPVHDAPPKLPQHIVPASQMNGGKAAVSPEGGGKQAAKLKCSPADPCAIPTPAAR